MLFGNWIAAAPVGKMSMSCIYGNLLTGIAKKSFVPMPSHIWHCNGIHDIVHKANLGGHLFYVKEDGLFGNIKLLKNVLYLLKNYTWKNAYSVASVIFEWWMLFNKKFIIQMYLLQLKINYLLSAKRILFKPAVADRKTIFSFLRKRLQQKMQKQLFENWTIDCRRSAHQSCLTLYFVKLAIQIH